MKWSVGLALFYLFSIVCADGEYNVHHYEGRSGNIIVQADNTVVEDSILLLHGQQFDSLSLTSLEDIHYADLLAHVFGLELFNVHTRRTGFPNKIDFFNKPRVAVSFVLDSVGTDGFKHATLENFHKVDVTTTAFPPNIYSLAANLATGTHPSQHGIVGQSWRRPSGKKVDAYSPEGQSLIANFADLLAQEFDGKSLIISASSATLSEAFAVHPHLVIEHPEWNSFAFAMEGMDFLSVYGNNARLVDISKVLEHPQFHAFANVEKKDNTFVAQTVSFDMGVQEDFVLFAELGFVYKMVDLLTSDPHYSALAQDSFPDFFSFTFSSLKAIREKYGEDSEKFTASLVLVNDLIKRAIEEVNKIYNDRAVSSVIYLHTQVISDDMAKHFVLQNVREYLHHEYDFEDNYPAVFVRSSEASIVCAILQELFTDAKIHCLSNPYGDQNLDWADYLVADNDTSTNSTKGDPKVPAFWILFWMSILIFLFVLAGVYGLIAIGADAGKDSLLYRSAGRHLHQS